MKSLTELAAALTESAPPSIPDVGNTPDMLVGDLMELLGDNVVQATPDALRDALDWGGRLKVTVRSTKTGAHVKIVLLGRKKKAGGKGYVPRTQKAGRVGLLTGADVIEARDPERDYPDNYVGRFYADNAVWRPGKDADPARAWAAAAVLDWAINGKVPVGAEVFRVCLCSSCGKELSDPVSILRGEGPECFGSLTESRHAAYAAR